MTLAEQPINTIQTMNLISLGSTQYELFKCTDSGQLYAAETTILNFTRWIAIEPEQWNTLVDLADDNLNGSYVR